MAMSVMKASHAIRSTCLRDEKLPVLDVVRKSRTSIRDLHFNRIKTYFRFLVNPNKKQQDKYIKSWVFQANSRHQVGLGGHQALHAVSGSGPPWDLVLTITHSHILKYHRKFWSNMNPFSSLSPTFKISRYVHIFPCQISCLHPAFLNLFM